MNFNSKMTGEYTKVDTNGSDQREPNHFVSKDYLSNKYYHQIFQYDDINGAIQSIYQWTDIEKLNLIISVTGGALNFNLPSRIKTAFKTGIAKIAVSTNALIITGMACFLHDLFKKNILCNLKYLKIFKSGGTSTGVMKLVGDAISTTNVKIPDKKINLLGIAHLERIKYSESLISKQKAEIYEVVFFF